MSKNKWAEVEKLIKNLGSVLVAYSGGVDSSLLAKISYDILGDKALAVTIHSTLNTDNEMEDAKKSAKNIGIKHIVMEKNPLSNKRFTANNQKRCYFCKNHIFSKLKKIAKQNSLAHVIEASNFSDLSDYRPGMQACKELKIIQPFVITKITKNEIRAKSKSLGLKSWNKPSSPCLITRISYGDKITEKKLRAIEKGEKFLKTFGFYNLRLRVQNETARIETDKNDFEKILINKEKIIKKLKSLGFLYITLDIEGFRSGSLNAAILKKI